MNLTFSQTLKVWWSFVWRHLLLTIPIIVLIFAMAFVMAFTSMKGLPPGSKPQLPIWFPILTWLVVMPLSVAVQILALHWALQVKWSDFRLAVVPPEDKQ